MKVACKYHQTSQVITLYFPDELEIGNRFTGSHIENYTITANNISRDPTETIITGNLSDSLITTAKIAKLAVDTEQLAELAVEAGKLAGGTTVGSALVDDDCADDDTGDWSVALDAVNSTITFDTDHYELSSNGDDDEIFYVGSLSTNNGDTYYLSLDVKDGTESSELIQLVNLNGTTVETVSDYTTSSSFTTVTHLFAATDSTDGVGIRIPSDLEGDNIEIKDVTLYNVTSGAVTSLKVSAAAIGAGAIATAAIGTAKIADAAIIDAKVKNLDAGKITTGYLAAERIEAGSITLATIGSDFDLSSIGGDLDDIDNGDNYGKVNLTAIDAGYIYLIRKSADSTERLEITAGGVEGYANNVKNFELGSGTAYLGDQSNEHIKLSSSGMEIKDGATVLATYAGTVTIGNTTGKHAIMSADNIRLKNGNDIYAEFGSSTIFYDTNGADRLIITTSSIITGDANSGYYLQISSSGVAGYSNTVKTLELLTGGVALLGDQSNEHIKLSSSGLEIKDGATVLARYGSDVTIGQVAASQDNINITSGAIQFRNNTTVKWSISNTGVSSFKLDDGSDITLSGNDGNPAKIVWDGTLCDLEIYANTTGGRSYIVPSNDDISELYNGVNTARFINIYNYAEDGIYFYTTNYGIIFDNTNASFRPLADSTIELGSNNYCWTDVRADAGVTACSDTRWKTILGQEPLGLEFIKKLPFVEYELNKNGKKRKGTYRGLTGQDLEQALIECNYDPRKFAGLKYDNIDGEEWLSIIYEQLISPLGRAVQELADKLELKFDTNA